MRTSAFEGLSSTLPTETKSQSLSHFYPFISNRGYYLSYIYADDLSLGDGLLLRLDILDLCTLWEASFVFRSAGQERVAGGHDLALPAP
jgi:hypothetical protein